jgi:putative heme-binding domain-containing protein
VLSLGLAFGYGVIVAEYEVFPFSVLKFLQSSNARFRGSTADGRVLFDSLCAHCHGADGSGAYGPSLRRSRLSRAPDDEALRSVIVNGIPNGRMAPVRQTTVEEQNDLIAYVRSLGRATPTSASGAAGRGRQLYAREACGTCHVRRGRGTPVGPELTDVAALRGPDYLRQALTDPGAALPTGASEILQGRVEYLPVRVVTRDGREIRGMRVNEDAFTLQLRDLQHQLHSFDKAELFELERTPRESVMPPYGDRLTQQDVDDLVAYLSSESEPE